MMVNDDGIPLMASVCAPTFVGERAFYVL